MDKKLKTCLITIVLITILSITSISCLAGGIFIGMVIKEEEINGSDAEATIETEIVEKLVYINQDSSQRYIDENNLTEAEIKNTVYANLIGIYNTDEDLENMIRKIENLGYSPYIVKDQKNRSVLFVGAFITEEGAVEQDAELRSHGMDNQVVKR